MNRRLLEIRLRRAELQGLIAEQRGQLAEVSLRWQGIFRLADRGMSVYRFLRQQRLVFGILSAALFKRRREAWRVARVSFGLWEGLAVFRGLANRWLPSADTTQR